MLDLEGIVEMIKDHGVTKGKTGFVLHAKSRRRQEYMRKRLKSVTPAPTKYLAQDLDLIHFSDLESVD